jgi:hypothetical protein
MQQKITEQHFVPLKYIYEYLLGYLYRLQSKNYIRIFIQNTLQEFRICCKGKMAAKWGAVRLREKNRENRQNPISTGICSCL